jgi:uncharacterized membrane protein required for colicin V production
VNWLDIVLIAVIVVAALIGMRFGLIRGAITAVGVYIGWLLAGQYSDDIGALFEESPSNDALVTVISYAVIMVGALIVSGILARLVRPLLTVFTLGMSSLVDRLGGLVVGLLIGVAIAGALIIGMARLTYNFDIESIAESAPLEKASRVARIGDQLARVEDTREQLESALANSQLVSAFIDVTDAIPGDTLGFVPSDFKFALEILEEHID